MSFISLYKFIKAVVPEPCIFFGIPAPVAEVAAVIPSGANIFFPKEQKLSLMGLQIYLIIILKILHVEKF